ncbi:unnamed protein product [Brugia timori]|uniref:RNA-binding protein 25-like n=1 Tax=Brugia timori TaxID=42155 RepID=A0A0R3R8J3_9BILA|nr:unnamed protein product [Brugia timori]
MEEKLDVLTEQKDKKKKKRTKRSRSRKREDRKDDRSIRERERERSKGEIDRSERTRERDRERGRDRGRERDRSRSRSKAFVTMKRHGHTIEFEGKESSLSPVFTTDFCYGKANVKTRRTQSREKEALIVRIFYFYICVFAFFGF